MPGPIRARRTGRGSAPGVGDGDDDHPGCHPHADLGLGRAGVLDHIGQRLLHHPVAGQADGVRHRAGPGDLRVVDPHAGRDASGGGPAGQRAQLSQARARPGQVVVPVGDPHEPAQVGQGLAPAVRHGLQSLAGTSGVGVGDQVSGPGLDDHHADAVAEHVVQLARDPVPLVGRGPLLPLLLLLLELGQGDRERTGHGSVPGRQQPEAHGQQHERRPGRNDLGGPRALDHETQRDQAVPGEQPLDQPAVAAGPETAGQVVTHRHRIRFERHARISRDELVDHHRGDRHEGGGHRGPPPPGHAGGTGHAQHHRRQPRRPAAEGRDIRQCADGEDRRRNQVGQDQDTRVSLAEPGRDPLHDQDASAAGGLDHPPQ